MVYTWKQGFKVNDGESDEVIREAEMRLCLSENGMNSKKQIREIFEFADLNFFHLFRGEDVQKKDGCKKCDCNKCNGNKCDGNKVVATDNKQELDINRGWLI